MARIQWQTAFETGIPDIDRQHMKLIGVINRLEDSLGTDLKVDHSAVLKVLADLVEYANYHFAFEQQFQQEMAFSEHVEHAARHSEFLAWLHINLTDPDLENSRTVLALLDFLMDWFLKHVLVEDMKYARVYAQSKQSSGRKTAVV
jgi:hemerythrin